VPVSYYFLGHKLIKKTLIGNQKKYKI